MKKIILFINGLSSGGAEHQLVQLADGLAEKGYSITITTFGDSDDHYSFSPLVMRHRIAYGKSKFIKMLAVWKYFMTINADWVIAFGQRESLFALEGLLFQSQHKIHVIAGDRNITNDEPTFTEKLLTHVFYKRADYIVPNSYAQKKHIIETTPIYKDKTITITNYTDLAKFTPTALPQDTCLHIGVFSRYHEQKNCLRFVDAIRILKEKCQQPFVIEWYGNQHFKNNLPNAYYQTMKEKVEKFGLSDILILKDHVKDVQSLMPCFDAICLPSLREGFSNSIGEAICCGKPCLVSEVADNTVMVQNGINGFIFNPEDIESITNAFIKYFSLTPKEREEMGTASRRRAEELFNRERFFNAYIDLLESK